MDESTPPRSDATQPDPAQFSREDMQSALFAQLVMQQSGMAMMLLGKSPHPETGKSMRDLEAAQLFIGQLEMLEAKTRGNLNKTEETLLKQTLMSLRMTFVEAVDQPQPETPSQPQSETPPQPQDEAKAEPKAPETADEKKPPSPETSESGESKKRFYKKFSL